MRPVLSPAAFALPTVAAQPKKPMRKTPKVSAICADGCCGTAKVATGFGDSDNAALSSAILGWSAEAGAFGISSRDEKRMRTVGIEAPDKSNADFLPLNAAPFALGMPTSGRVISDRRFNQLKMYEIRGA